MCTCYIYIYIIYIYLWASKHLGTYNKQSHILGPLLAQGFWDLGFAGLEA